MKGQMTLDAVGTRLFADLFFKKVLRTSCTPATPAMQLKGIDLAMRLNSRGTTGVDLKIDTYHSGNLALEIVSQDRGTTQRVGPAPGWPGKDMRWVAYYFIKTGEVVFMDMRQVYGWLEGLLAEGCRKGKQSRTMRYGDLSYWVSGTPNETYISYNVMVKVADLLLHCPGLYYLRLQDYLSLQSLEEYTGVPLITVLVPAPVETAWTTPDELRAELATAFDYDVKAPRSPEDSERYIRWCERVAQFSIKPGVLEKGRELQSTRLHTALAEDARLAKAA